MKVAATFAWGTEWVWQALQALQMVKVLEALQMKVLEALQMGVLEALLMEVLEALQI